MKMKLSVLFGVLQMTVGVLLKWSNAVFENNWVDFVFECIPQMIFMLCFFGWMDFMILFKWTNHIDNPPSIIKSLICMAMHQPDDMPFYDGSVQTANTLMLFTVLAVPIMLLPKPFILLAMHNAKKSDSDAGALVNVEDSDEEEATPAAAASAGHGGDHGGHGEEFEFGEVFIHQIIETIEYVLGTVSHTASYLRIWALSLAHQQLSLVFFQKTLSMGLNMNYPANGFALYFLFGAWFGVTVGVLLGMDVLECFLHTLRLHWVEFQSKFYKAEGQLFEPYSINQLVAPNPDAD
jgi:V-type H+-transporting ATPase subunit a